jgi:hypothetical protein
LRVLSMSLWYSFRVFGLRGLPLELTRWVRQWSANCLRVRLLGSSPPLCGVWSACQVPDSIACLILVSSSSAVALVLNVVRAVRLCPFGSV